MGSRTLVATVALAAALSACGRRNQPVVAQQADPLFSNGGFEAGNLTSWTVSVYWNNGITYPPQSYADLHLQTCGAPNPGGNPECVNRTSVKTNPAPESQQMTGLAALASPRWPKFGTATAVVNEQGFHQNVNSLKQQYRTTAADVDPSDGKIHARFALSPQLQNAGHPANQQPYFYVTLRNLTKATTLYQTFNFSNQPGIPWQSQGSGATAVMYTDWQVFDIAPGNAALFVGDTIEIEIVAAGCSPNGHWGQVFVDGFGAMLPSLSITKSAPQWVLADADLTYTFQVENATSLVARNAFATEVLPAGTSYKSVVFPPGGTCTTPAVGAVGTGAAGGPTVVCQLGWMNPSSSQTFKVTVHTDPALVATVVTNGNYWVEGDGINPILGPKVDTSIGNGPFADVAVTVSDGVSAVRVGDPVTYTITATNFGPTSVTTVTVTDTFPARLSVPSWTCAGAAGGTCRTPSGSGDLTAGNGVVSLPAGASAIWTVAATVTAGPVPATLVNTAQATATGVTDTNPANDSDSDVDSIGAALDPLTISTDAADSGLGQVISSPAGISCGPTCSAQFLDGAQVTLTAIARAGDMFDRWSGGCVGTANVCTLTVSGGPAAVTAHFRGPLVVGSAPAGHGTIACSPSPVVQQTSSTCTIVPAAGYELSALTDNGVDVLTTTVRVAGAYTLAGPALVNDHDAIVATFMKARGTGCAAGGECTTGLCVDGVCCDATCAGQCQACNLGGQAGTCSPVTGAPAGGRPACATDGTLCGGACDGVVLATCAYPGASTVCGGGGTTCSGGVESLTAACTGSGACGAPPTVPCSPYVCGATACLASCASDAQCAAGSWCSGGACVAKLAAGQTCSATAQCQSGHCVDGVCCDQACSGQCEACDAAGHVGTCSPVTGVPVAPRAACLSDGSACGGACDGARRSGCAYPLDTVACRGASCAGGTATLAASCNGQGSCPAVQTQACAPLVCGPTACTGAGACASESDCTTGRWCSGGVCVPKLAQGASCGAPIQCASGHCVDGVCCDQACSGQCEACDVPSFVGTCSGVSGAPQGARPACETDLSACGGACDPASRTACTYPLDTVSCRPGSCAGGVATLAASCDGAGHCPALQTEACAPYLCGATACAGNCTVEGDCAAGQFCAGGVCAPKLAAGRTCAAADQCASGFCTDGLCCNAACGGQCEACDVPSFVGTCTPTIGDPVGARPACADDGSSCGGACSGASRTACAYPAGSVQCRAPSCSGAVSTLSATCSGSGSCPAPQHQSCAPYVCGGAACAGNCTSDAGCVAGDWCSAGVCTPLLTQGATCGASSQCAGGHCVDGVCCDQACGSTCQACDVPGHAGTCFPVVGAPHGARPHCTSDGTTCGGSCDGADVTACAYPGASTSCRTAFCAAGVAHPGAACNGTGTCPSAAPPAACATGSCDGAVCTAPTYKLAGSGCSSAGGPSLAPLAILGLLLVPLRRRTRGRRIVVALGVLVLAPGPARAQATNVDVQRFDPSGGAYDLLAVPSARVPGTLAASGAVLGDYGARPLRLVSPNAGTSVNLVDGLTTGVVAASVGFLGWSEVSVALPLLVAGTGRSASAVDPRFSGATPASGVGDLRLTPKVSLTSEGSPVAVALLAPVTFPTGSATYLSGSTIAASPRAALEIGSLRGARLLADAGVNLRPARSYEGVQVGSAFVYGVAGELPLAGGAVSVLATVCGMAGRASDRPLEALAALRVRGPGGLAFTIGGGPGLSQSFGTPQYRVVGGIEFVRSRPAHDPEAAAPAPAERAGADAVAVTPSAPRSASVASAAPPGKSPASTTPARPAPARVAQADPKAFLRNNRIVIVEPLQFVPGREVVAPGSVGLLGEVAGLLRAHPEIGRLRIEVHTDDDGTPAQLMERSIRRAVAVRDQLVRSGVEPLRLEARGYGDTRPLLTNYTPQDRATNRRVEFVVVPGGAPPARRAP